MFLLIACVVLCCLMRPRHVTWNRTTDGQPAGDRDMFATHFQAGFRFLDGTQLLKGSGQESSRYPRLPDDWPQFFLPRTQPQFSLDLYPYLHQATGTCSSPVHLLVLVLSSPHHGDRRQAVRRTWGSVARGQTWPGDREQGQEHVALVFLLGQDQSQTVSQEYQQYGDVVQWGGLHDSYYNLTMKVLLGLRWASQFCQHAKHVIKTDDDTFVHVPRILRRVRSFGWTDSICGAFYKSSPCSRQGKYAVSREAYPFDMYPPHVKGNLYILPGGLVARLVMVAPYLPYNNMEDVHVTGTLARTLQVRHQPFLRREFSVVPRSPQPCLFKDDVTLGGQQVEPRLAYLIWATFSDSRLCTS